MIDFIRHGLSISLFAQECLDITFDDWQTQVVNSTKNRFILLCSRQAGKSTTSAIIALHQALFKPNSLILLVGPAERQSKELLKKIKFFYDMLPGLPDLEENNKLSFELWNGSRIVALPGSHSTIRGYSGPQLIIEDESAQCPDELFAGIIPMLATVKDGRLMLLSSPYGRQGHFYSIFTSDDDSWERVKIPATDCSRISSEYLEEQRRILPEFQFKREFLCEWGDEDDSIFKYDCIMAAMADIAPLFPTATQPKIPGLSNIEPLFKEKVIT